MFGLTYVFSRINFLQFQFKKIIFRNLVKIWNVRGTPVTVTVTVIVTVTVSFEVPRWNVGPSIYIGTPKKIWGKKVNVKFFTVDPYFGVTFLTGQENHPTFTTFRQLWPWWGVRVGKKIVKPHFGIGQGNVW